MLFLRSRVSISWAVRELEISARTRHRLTMSTKLKVEKVADTDIDDTKKALVATFEFALVEDLDGHHR